MRAETAGLHRIAGVVEIDAVSLAGAERFGEVHEDGAGIALVLERDRAQEDLVDVQGGMQVELDAGGVLQHFEADGVLPLRYFFSGSTRTSRW